ncbi:hybrid sensor histidine kinase/response regulator [Salinarchaeum laminariae]|uniref:hybrid sensor histidine kinase/response regulator n=1 Tax=Salinarchaeum laminariae TaxID=869888 RepID=UPI0020C0E172|nr:response regulator [Salinarchaeum laminariae]
MSEPIRILHVDDDPEFLELSATLLEREDDRFHVETATSADAALETLDTLDESVDCIVSDHEMPEFSGVELLENVREEYPELPFVLFTGRGSEAVASEAISAGVTDYLQKETGTSQYAVLANRIANAVEQDRSRRELQASRRRLSLFFERSPLGVVEWNGEFEFARVNAAAEEILGYDEQELVGTHWSEIVPESERSGVEDVTAALVEDESGYHNVNENVRGDGERIVCEWHNRVVSDSEGAVLAIFSQFQDVTDRKEREWELQRHRENLERLHEAANRLYAAQSADACYDIMIDAAVTILGFDWCTVATPADDDPDVFEIRAISEDTPLAVGDRPFGTDEGLSGKVYQTKEASLVDDVTEASEGEPTDDAIRAALTVPIADRGIFQAVSTTRATFDEQDQKHAEILVAAMLAAVERIERQAELRERQRELERQNDRLDEFASVVSHDLRNPLAVANGRLELAREEIDSEDLDIVADAHDRMQTLIDGLLTLAREGEAPTETEPVDLATVASRSWQAVDTAEATLHAPVDSTVIADENRLRQLFENCFRNAVEHSPPDAGPQSSPDGRDDCDAVAVTIGRLESESEEEGIEGFYIEDDGPGIAAADRDDVLEFGYSTSAEGTGLGLSIVSQVVDAHGWEIDVVEGTEGGARFEIRGVETADG